MFELPTEYIETYKKDKRKPINEIYQALTKLSSEKWSMDVLYTQELEIESKKIPLPIVAFRTKKTGRALWLIAGIHGEEPAGVNALSKNIKLLNKLAQRIPIVLLPLCNPKGYVLNWRYPNKRKMRKNMKIAPSVSGSEHYLIDDTSAVPKARANQAPCIEASKITTYTIKTSKKYPPILSIDLHEDYGNNKVYIYSQGELGSNDLVAKEVVSILKRKGFKFYEEGMTLFNQYIKNGIIEETKDDSIDELLSSKKIIISGRIINGPSAKSVIVVETPSKRIPLKKRISAHSIIIKNLKRFFNIVRQIQTKEKKAGEKIEEITKIQKQEIETTEEGIV